MRPLLIVDDRADDRYLLERALRKFGVKNSFLSFSDGKEVTDYLEGPGAFIGRLNHPHPTVIFLDLDMPRLNGFETLTWIQDKKRAEDFFIVVVTAVRGPSELQAAYALGARSYLGKPLNEAELMNLIDCYPEYWDRKRVSEAIYGAVPGNGAE
jgi:CheY-like chemotaxis protein